MDSNVIKPFEEREPYRPEIKETPTPKAKTAETVQEKTDAFIAETDQIKEAITNALNNLVDKSDEESTYILNDLFDILSIITQIIQKIARTQANDLTQLTKMQAAYTKMQGNVKIYNTSNPPSNVVWGKDDEKTVLEKIGQANQEQSIVIERLRNLRDMLAEDAKKLQAKINASDDAQKGMLDFMQTYLQKMREWLASITAMTR
jgi:hypothetical protein